MLNFLVYLYCLTSHKSNAKAKLDYADLYAFAVAVQAQECLDVVQVRVSEFQKTTKMGPKILVKGFGFANKGLSVACRCF